MSFRLAIDVVNDYLQAAPVDLDGMAAALGIEVKRAPFFDPEIAGVIERHGSGYRIQINSNDPPRRQRFTLAHEIGHYVLHRDLIGNGIEDRGLYRSRLSDETERQANRYAESILMPGKLVREMWREGNCSVSGLAQKFNLSEEATRIRLKNLGYGA